MAWASSGVPKAEVAVLLINWNSWRFTAEAYRSLLKSDFRQWVLIIVDNASSDDSLIHLRGLGPEVHIVESPSNLGFSGGCNLALEAAEKLGVEFVFFLNNDCTVTPSTLGALVSASVSLHNNAVLGAVVRYSDDGALQFFRAVSSSTLGVPELEEPKEERLSAQKELIESDFIFGAALFAPMSIVRSVGRFDERFFLNFEETDWCYRAKKKGFSCVVVKNAETFHKGSASLGALGGPMQTYFIQRNRLLFCEKHVTPLQLIRTYFKTLRVAQGLMRRALGLSRRSPPGFSPRTKAYFLALRDYILRRFGDCPPIIRELARTANQLTSPEDALRSKSIARQLTQESRPAQEGPSAQGQA
jgi:GT2 family glycosyltransferase